MPLETGTRIGDLNPLWPLGTDPKSQGDDHIRLVKNVLVETLGDLADETLAEWLAPQLAAKLDLAGGTMTGALTLRTDDDTDAFTDDEAVPKRYVDAFQIGVEEFHDPTETGSWKIVGNTLECWGRVLTTSPPSPTVFPKVFARAPVVTATSEFHSSTVNTTLEGPTTPTEFEIGSWSGLGGWIAGTPVYWHAIGEVAPDPPP